MAIQSLSICCPVKNHRCINHCETCTARQHTNPYEDKFDSTRMDCFEYWQDVIKRMEYAIERGCPTLMLTGSNEPQQNRRWIEELYLAMRSLRTPFKNIEIQSTGARMDYDYFQFLKAIGVTTFALSAFNIDDDGVNKFIIGTPDDSLCVKGICEKVTSLGMNLRLCLNVTDYLICEHTESNYHEVIESLLDRCAELRASQVTFRKMWSVEGTPEAEWIKEHCQESDAIIKAMTTQVKNRGTLLGKLPYGAERYDYKGFSIVIDTDSMAKDESNQETKYYIIRENGKMYSAWDSPASIVF